MSKKFSKSQILIVAVLLSFGAAIEARGQVYCDQSFTEAAGGSAWTLSAKTLFLDRSDDDAAIFSGANGNFDADEFGLGIQPGYEISARYALNSCTALTVRWMSVDRWREDHRDLVGTASNANLNTAAPISFPGVTGIEGVHTSDLHSFGLGISHQLIGQTRLTGGFRYLEMDDHNAFSLDSGAATTTVTTDASNRLYGGQMGIESMLWQYGQWSIDGFAQAGIFGNAAKQNSRFDTGITAATSSGNAGKVSFVGELGTQVRRGITTHLDLVAGYQMMWITSAAVASNELLGSNFTTGSGIDASEGLFYHGATVGIEYRR